MHYASVEGLRLLANSYKHEPGLRPSKDLIKYLKLNQRFTYAQIPESFELRKGLALLVGVSERAGFTEITERFAQPAQAFLKGVKSRNTLTQVK